VGIRVGARVGLPTVYVVADVGIRVDDDEGLLGSSLLDVSSLLNELSLLDVSSLLNELSLLDVSSGVSRFLGTL
jgi:hypothetical protein